MSRKKEVPPPPAPPTIRGTVPVKETFQDYFLQYASYVITDRAIPDFDDGLKPVQRRILHSLWENEDGRFNKVANIVGHCMKYHPHGDASITSALVGMGQKDLLIDTQGNWGDPVTGDDAAAARYIEARLTKFAKEVVFAPHLTRYKLSYDGRNKEPITLPVRFPLVLATGAEGIAVGLTTKILPHNFLELLDAQKKALRKEPFEIVPDFPTGGLADAQNYNDGRPGGRVKVRARMETDGKSVIIREIPYGTTTQALIDSIIDASEKGKIKLARIDDNSAAKIEIVVTFQRGVDMDKAFDALYAFTNCEMSHSPVCVVIREGRPEIVGVSDYVKWNAEQTRDLLRQDLEYQRDQLEMRWHHKSLVQIFVENRIYLRIEKAKSWEAVLTQIDQGLEPFKPKLRRPVTNDDLVMLTEVRIRRISAWDAEKAREELVAIENELKVVNRHLRNVTKYTIDWFDHLIETYGEGRERKTELTTFDAVKAVTVAARTQKLYVERTSGFVGTELKNAEELGPCSTIDDVLVILQDGGLVVTRVDAKKYVGERILHAQVFEQEHRETVFNVVYEEPKSGKVFAKRFTVGGVTRDKRYEIAGKAAGKILYLSIGDEQFAYVKLRKKPRIKTDLYVRFDEILVKGRGAGGVTVSKHRASSASAISRNVYCDRIGVAPDQLPVVDLAQPAAQDADDDDAEPEAKPASKAKRARNSDDDDGQQELF